jgi:hypothetical protein
MMQNCVDTERSEEITNKQEEAHMEYMKKTQ